jgi:hypothetical protein
MRQFTYEIYEQDCVGSSAGKHNFNSLSLETQICNLSSNFMSPTNTYNTSMEGFLAEVDKLKGFGDISRYIKTYTTVSLLSSFWNTQDFSVLYPLNISSINNLPISNPTIQTPGAVLNSLAQSYLTVNFPPSNFLPNTKASVNMFVYSEAFNPSDPNHLQATTVDKEFSFMNRTMSVSQTRKDVHLDHGNILQFVNVNNSWKCVNVISPLINLNDSNRKKIFLNVNSFQTNYNIGTAVSSRTDYVPGFTDIVVTIADGVFISASTPSEAALTIGNLQNGDYVILFNNGTIIGAGGTGGTGGNSFDTGSVLGSNGGEGGVAIAAFMPCTIENRGHIYGGGGGGAGGTGGLTGSNSVGGGGGGGAGSVGGLGGTRGSNKLFKSKNVFVKDGSNGTETKAGIGGPGLSSDPRATGGSGGLLGQPGLNSDSAFGGSAGNYILGNTNVYWSIAGDVLGNIA